MVDVGMINQLSNARTGRGNGKQGVDRRAFSQFFYHRDGTKDTHFGLWTT